CRAARATVAVIVFAAFFAARIRGHPMTLGSDTSSHLKRGTPGYRNATLALFCAGFATFALLYCVQPLLPLLASRFAVSAASSSLALSLTTLSLALCLLIAGALGESWGRKPVMAVALGLASLPGRACVRVECWAWLLAV